jgi:hypothetical protein
MNDAQVYEMQGQIWKPTPEVLQQWRQKMLVDTS